MANWIAARNTEHKQARALRAQREDNAQSRREPLPPGTASRRDPRRSDSTEGGVPAGEPLPWHADRSLILLHPLLVTTLAWAFHHEGHRKHERSRTTRACRPQPACLVSVATLRWETRHRRPHSPSVSGGTGSTMPGSNLLLRTPNTSAKRCGANAGRARYRCVWSVAGRQPRVDSGEELEHIDLTGEPVLAVSR